MLDNGYSFLYITLMANKSGSRNRSSLKDRIPDSASGKKYGYELNGRIWIEKKNKTYMGYGRVVLLERIKHYGSITKAAKSMKMSYRHAWELVDSMNRQAETTLVETLTGGRGGGGARLTNAGEKAIEAFWRLYNRFRKYLKDEMSKVKL